MKGFGSRSSARLLFAAAGAPVVVAAFLRGNYLLGLVCGAVYAVIAVAILWLLARSRIPAGGVSVMRAVFVVTFALPIGYALAFPASINPDVQSFVDNHRARAELADVLESAPVYRGLSVSPRPPKEVYITVHGSLGTRGEFEQLRSRLGEECPTLGECGLDWDVYLRDARETVSGLDDELFEDAKPAAAVDQSGR